MPSSIATRKGKKMRAGVGAVVAAVAASACCLGPVVLTVLGAGTLAASSVRLEPYRPFFLAVTGLLLGTAYYTTYRPALREACSADGSCPPATRRAAKIVLWVATVLVVLLATFPYYVNFLF